MSTSGEVLSKDAIFLGRTGESMQQAIEFVGGELVRRGIVEAAYVEGMKARERSVSTYLGNGVALPHGTFETKGAIRGTAIVVAQYPDGVDWNGESAHLVIGLAAVGDDHVAVLSQLAEVLQDEDLCHQLWHTGDPSFVYDTIHGDGLEGDLEEVGSASATVTISNPAGLHARPAAMIVEAAKGMLSEIHIAKDSKSASAKSIMSVLTLGAATGDTVTVSVEGPDAEDALAAVVRILTSSEDQL